MGIFHNQHAGFINKLTYVLVVAVIAVCGILAPQAAQAAAPKFVQVKDKKVTTGTTASVLLNPTAGNLLVVYVLWDNTGVVAVTDTKNNNYIPVAPATKFNNVWHSQIFYAVDNTTPVPVGGNTIKATFGTAIKSWGMVYAHEYSGMDKVNPLVTANAVLGTGSAMNSSIATQHADSLIFAAAASNNWVTSVGQGFTTRSTLSGDRTMDKVAGPAGTYSITGTQSGNKWLMHMVAFKPDAGTPDTQAPTMPEGFQAVPVSTAQISLNWTASSDNVGVVGYKIFRDGQQVGTTTTTSYQDTGLAGGTSYSYTVNAYDAAGNTSAMSAPVTATTQTPDTTAPEVTITTPTEGATLSGSMQVTASATDNSGVTKVEFFVDGLLRSTHLAQPYSYLLDTTTLTAGAHTLSAKAYDAAGNSAVSSEVNVVVDNTDYVAPSTPVGLQATALSTTHISLSWNAATDNIGVAGYKVFRDNTEVANVTGTTHQDIGLTPGTTYNYTVSAYDAAGNSSAQSASASATTQALDTTPPTVPADVTATVVSATQVDLSWAASSDNVAVVSYKIYRNDAEVATVAGTSFQNMGLVPNTTYQFMVSAQDAAGNSSAQSVSVNATTPALPPAPPLTYDRIVVNASAPADAWMKGAGDLSGDGKEDLVVSSRTGVIKWYRAPDWAEFTIPGSALSESGAAVADIDGDGDTDVVIGHHWFANNGNGTGWVQHNLPGGALSMTHDVTTADINHDGKRDIIMRGESSSPVHVFLNNSSSWTHFSVDPGYGKNGLEIEDINADGRRDIVVGGVWLQNPGGNIATTAWTKYTFTTGWHEFASVRVADIDADGKKDIALGVSEAVGDLAWFKQPADPTSPNWVKHTVATSLTMVHGFDIADMDKDGQLDFIASEYGGDGQLSIYLNKGVGQPWQQKVLGTDALHNVQVVDTNDDGTLDFYGVHSWGTQPAILYQSVGSPDTQAPTTPTNLTGVAPSSTQVDLSWTASTDNTAVAGYTIFRNNVPLASIGSVTTYTDTNLAASTTYQYEVSARDSAGNYSARTPVVTVTTQAPPPADTTPPVITAVTTSNVTGSAATVAWTTDEPSDSQVHYGLTTAYGTSSPLNATLQTTHSVNLSGLSANTTYHYSVVSKDSAGNLVASADFSFTTGAVASVQHVQAAGATSNAYGPDISQAFASANSAGNLLVLSVSWEGSESFTCSDTQGNSYVTAITSYDPNNMQSLGVCYAANAKAGANTVKATFPTSRAFRRLVINEFSGIATVNPVDVMASNVSSGTLATSGSATTTTNGSLIFGVVMDDTGPNTITAGPGFTQTGSVNNKDLATQYMVQATGGSVASTQTFGASHRYLAQMIAFKAAQ